MWLKPRSAAPTISIQIVSVLYREPMWLKPEIDQFQERYVVSFSALP